MEELTAFQRDLLFVIAGSEEQYGLAIKRDVSAYRGEKIHPGRLYPNLDTLVENGYVDKSELDRRTNHYTLTETGREAISERMIWQEEMLSGI